MIIFLKVLEIFLNNLWKIFENIRYFFRIIFKNNNINMDTELIRLADRFVSMQIESIGETPNEKII